MRHLRKEAVQPARQDRRGEKEEKESEWSFEGERSAYIDAAEVVSGRRMVQ
jgi:hypothetical protein